MDIIEQYKKAWSHLQPHLITIWVSFYILLILSAVLGVTLVGLIILFIPFGGFLWINLNLIRDKKTPEIGDLFGQFDKFIPLAICSILFVVASFVVILLCGMLARIVPGFGFLSNFVLLLINPFLIIGFTYATLFICDKNENAIDAIKKGFGVFSHDLANQYLLGLGVMILSIPCFLGAPLGYSAIVIHYKDKVSQGA